ncbi:hypothetical protein EHS39_11375 [Ensifer sp. MPMI2T]|nr:hypothetical protein EHS39_11375 [Ensifer sp. MPMI2T]
MSFAFDEGQCVNHRSGMMASIVVGRSKTARGKEQYHIRQIAVGPRRYHWMLSDALVGMSGGEAECEKCRLREVCPMAVRKALDYIAAAETKNAQPDSCAQIAVG